MEPSIVSLENILPALPVVALVTWATLLLVIDLFIERKMLTATIALAGLLLSAGLLILHRPGRRFSRLASAAWWSPMASRCSYRA
jgi:hypothetical protein